MNRRHRARKLARRQQHTHHKKQDSRAFEELEAMTKPQLVKYADERGIVVAKSWNKRTMIDSIVVEIRKQNHRFAA